MTPSASRPAPAEPTRLGARWTRRWVPAREALHTHWQPALLLLGLGALGLATAASGTLAPTSSGAGPLSVAFDPGPIDAGVAWTSAARTPEGTANPTEQLL